MIDMRAVKGMLVCDRKFEGRVVAEPRALLATVSNRDPVRCCCWQAYGFRNNLSASISTSVRVRPMSRSTVSESIGGALS